MSDKLFEIQNLCVDYATDSGLARAVNNVSFSIREGEIFGLAGESGCGKSTIAFAISRLTKPPGIITGGKVLFHGEDVLQYDKRRLRKYRWAEVSVVFQSAMNSLNPVMSVAEQICDTIMAHEKVKMKEARERAGALLEMVGINKNRMDDFPHQFSGGMRQRIGIAIALALNPKLVIMDEPTTALDVVMQREILQEIYTLKERLGFSILFITHDLSLMVEFSDTIGIMYAGELVEIAKSKDILDRSRHPYTQALGRSYPSMVGPKVRLTGIPGNPPNLIDLPTGCNFQDRCVKTFADCKIHNPSLTAQKDNHYVACHYQQ